MKLNELLHEIKDKATMNDMLVAAAIFEKGRGL